jgi:hypothetical protein
MMRAWWQRICQFWSEARSLASYPGIIPPDPIGSVSPETHVPGQHPYYWFHYLFHYCMEREAAFKKQWENTCTLPADSAHEFQRLIRSNPHPDSEQAKTILSQSPVQKLDWRLAYQIEKGELAY